MAAPLLTTKLFIPSIRPELVPRPRLIERLNAGLHRKLTLISAPAGFGKTTLVAEWVGNLQIERRRGSHPGYQVAWLSLDEGDNGLTRFLSYLIAALNKLEGTHAALGEGALTLLQSSQPPPADIVLTSLINEFTTIPDRVLLILDDYHLIDAQPIHDALSFLLENIPPQMHLAIATREDPDLRLARLRARGQLTELRAADLRFTNPEAAAFLNKMMGLGLSADDIDALEARTEGWIAGLQLAAISLQGHGDTSRLIQSFAGSHRFVLDYLVEEVMQRQSERVRSFLLKTSVLDLLCGPLCEAVTGQENGKGMLEALERDNLFVVPLDDKRQWYRYHHLFADVLKAYLIEQQPGQVVDLHRHASEWYEQQELLSDAIHHALAGAEFERAAGLAELAWPAMSGSFQSIEWLSWLQALPDKMVRDRPVLCVGYAWAFLNSGNLEAAELRLQDAERLLETAADTRAPREEPPSNMVVVDKEQFQALPASLTTARAYHAQAIGDVAGTVKYAQRVLDLLPEGGSQWEGDATALLGLAYWASGDLDAAHSTMSAGLAGMKPLDVIIGTFVLADIKLAQGQLHAAVRAYEHALQLATEHGEPMPLGTEDVYSEISDLHREQGDLETAAQDLLTSKRLGEKVELPDWQYRWCIAKARLDESRGNLSGALDLLAEAERKYVRTPLPEVRPITALKARVWVKQGRLTEAREWARESGLSVDDDLSYLREFEHLTLGRVHIACYKTDLTNDTLLEALDLLERLLVAAEEGGRTGSVIEILVMKALAHEGQGDLSSALESLDRVLALAEPEGYSRIFVDEGPPMARLLYETLSGGIAPDYVQRLLGAFPEIQPEQPRPSKSLIPESALFEPLSEREIEVLQLISEGLTNQEIASRLYLSLHTVKGHARNIYGKLGVNNRTKAVAKGKSLGLLRPL